MQCPAKMLPSVAGSHYIIKEGNLNDRMVLAKLVSKVRYALSHHTSKCLLLTQCFDKWSYNWSSSKYKTLFCTILFLEAIISYSFGWNPKVYNEIRIQERKMWNGLNSFCNKNVPNYSIIVWMLTRASASISLEL